MFCTKCGAQNPDDARFCFSCGTALPTEGMAPPQAVPSPAVSAAAPPSPREPHYAGFWRRFVAMLIDGLILAIPSSILAVSFGLMSILPSLSQINDWESGNVDILGLLGTIFMMSIWMRVVLGALKWLYHALFESSKLQATPGKMALGIIVTDSQGNRISFARATGRHFAKIISTITLLIGFMMAGWTRKKQALHDMLADTLVVLR
jgi:uncharacterized RDD family membrane protein YckC